MLIPTILQPHRLEPFLREIYSPFLPSYPSVVAFLFSLIQRPERLYFSLLAFTSSPRRDIKRCT